MKMYIPLRISEVDLQLGASPLTQPGIHLPHCESLDAAMVMARLPIYGTDYIACVARVDVDPSTLQRDQAGRASAVLSPLSVDEITFSMTNYENHRNCEFTLHRDANQRFNFDIAANIQAALHGAISKSYLDAVFGENGWSVQHVQQNGKDSTQLVYHEKSMGITLPIPKEILEAARDAAVTDYLRHPDVTGSLVDISKNNWAANQVQQNLRFSENNPFNPLAINDAVIERQPPIRFPKAAQYFKQMQKPEPILTALQRMQHAFWEKASEKMRPNPKAEAEFYRLSSMMYDRAASTVELDRITSAIDFAAKRVSGDMSFLDKRAVMSTLQLYPELLTQVCQDMINGQPEEYLKVQCINLSDSDAKAVEEEFNARLTPTATLSSQESYTIALYSAVSVVLSQAGRASVQDEYSTELRHLQHNLRNDLYELGLADEVGNDEIDGVSDNERDEND